MLARHVRATGRVQGVFFRAWTKQAADELGVRGWVRNCTDGSLEAHLEGDEDEIDELIARMRDGPRGASVSELATRPAEVQSFSDFTLRH